MLKPAVRLSSLGSFASPLAWTPHCCPTTTATTALFRRASNPANALKFFSSSSSGLAPFSRNKHLLLTTSSKARRQTLSTMAPLNNYRLLCLENPLLDIIAKGDQALLQKYGLDEDHAILAEDKHLSIYPEMEAKGPTLVAGGAAQNTARGAQYVLPPDSVVFLGCVGADADADKLRRAAHEYGVRVEYKVEPAEHTGRCAVVVTGHHRTMVTQLGAANCYTLDHLEQPEIWGLAERAEVFFVGAYHFTVCPPAIMKLAKEAADKNKVFMLSISADWIPHAYKADFAAALPYVDYIVGNEKEAEGLNAAFALGAPAGDLKAIAKAIAGMDKVNKERKRVAIVTQGALPTLVAVEGEEEVREYPIHKIEGSQIVDTIGAGDAFAAGFVAALIQGKPLDECVDVGSWLARLGLTQPGAQFPFPKLTYPATS